MKIVMRVDENRASAQYEDEDMVEDDELPFNQGCSTAPGTGSGDITLNSKPTAGLLPTWKPGLHSLTLATLCQ